MLRLTHGCQLLNQFTNLKCFFYLKWTTNTHVIPFLSYNWQYLWFLKTNHPVIFIPVQNMFYLSKWRVGGSLHKAGHSVPQSFFHPLLAVVSWSLWCCMISAWCQRSKLISLAGWLLGALLVVCIQVLVSNKKLSTINYNAIFNSVSGKNLYNNEHVAIKLVSTTYFYFLL